jgi:nicotinamide-nucleotide amidase
MTRPAIARLFGRTLHEDPAIVERLRERFKVFGGKMPESNLVQAMVPEGARVLENGHGTAPGLWIEDDLGRWVAMLPGVPREARNMTVDTIVPLLRDRIGANPTVVLSRTVRTTGIGESALAEHLGELGRQVDGLPLAYLPGWEGVDLRLTARGLSRMGAERALDDAARKLYARAARYIYGEGHTDLAAVVIDACRARSLRIGTAESCTGGLLGARITAVSGSSDVYDGGIVAYANAVKVAQLGVSEALLREHGAVSEPVARAMATGVRRVLGTDIGVGITGIAGPGGGTPEKPVGTVWIAVDVQDDVRAFGRVYVGDRTEIRQRAAQSALDMVRRSLV